MKYDGGLTMADPKAREKQGYHQFSGCCEDKPWGSFEVFWWDKQAEDEAESGWMWWACFPGCLPDGEATGPFATSQEAYDNAQEGA